MTPLLVALLALAPAAGCGDGQGNRQAISGSVTLNGEPLDGATIEFAPTAGVSTFAAGKVVAGSYSIPADQGLAPGEYRVMISKVEAAARPPAEGAPGDPDEFPPPEELIPPEFNAESRLTARVESGADNIFDFDVKQ